MLKKRIISVLFLMLSSVLVLAACNSDESKDKEGSNDKKVQIKVASAFQDGTPMMDAAKKFKEIVEEKSDGEIEVKLFPNGTLGGEKDNVEQIKLKEIEMGLFGTFPIVSLTPDYAFFDAPFIFRDKAHYVDVWNGELGQQVRDEFEDKHGIHTLGLMGRGYRHVTSNKPINSVDDLKGIKMRMGQSEPFINAFTELEAVVSPIALTELFTSLQTGVVNASEGPYDQIYSYKLYETQDYLAILGHLYATSLWLMSDDFYSGLSDEHRGIIDAAAEEALSYGDQLTEEESDVLLQKLKDEGMEVTNPEYIPFMEKAKPALDKLFEQKWKVTTFDEIQNY